MDHISGIGGYAFSTRWRKVALSKKEKKALSVLNPVPNTPLMVSAHEDTEALRRFAERFERRRGGQKESIAQFVMDQETHQINLTIKDAVTGEVEMQLTPEQVVEGLRQLEESDDNEAPLSSFFIDIKV